MKNLPKKKSNQQTNIKLIHIYILPEKMFLPLFWCIFLSFSCNMERKIKQIQCVQENVYAKQKEHREPKKKNL